MGERNADRAALPRAAGQTEWFEYAACATAEPTWSRRCPARSPGRRLSAAYGESETAFEGDCRDREEEGGEAGQEENILPDVGEGFALEEDGF